MSNRFQMKKLVEVCFPVTYNEGFYEKVVQKYSDLSRYCLYKDLIVGGIVGRIEKDEKELSFVHLLVLLVLPPYRKRGFAKRMIDYLIQQIKDLNLDIDRLELHVQKINQTAVNFYLKQGFIIVEEKPDYYSNLSEPSAYYMTKKL